MRSLDAAFLDDGDNIVQLLDLHDDASLNRAYLANEYVKRVHGKNTGFTMYGSVTMNKAVGGINPSAVETALKLGAKVVWLPTQSAKNHLRKMGKDPSDGVDVVTGWKVVPQLLEVFRMVKDYDAVLGTAHVSPEECFVVVEAARNVGVRKVGFKNVMVDTDGGQTENPHWELALAEYIKYLADNGIPEEQIYHMTRTIPYGLQ